MIRCGGEEEGEGGMPLSFGSWGHLLRELRRLQRSNDDGSYLHR